MPYVTAKTAHLIAILLLLMNLVFFHVGIQHRGTASHLLHILLHLLFLFYCISVFISQICMPQLIYTDLLAAKDFIQSLV